MSVVVDIVLSSMVEKVKLSLAKRGLSPSSKQTSTSSAPSASSASLTTSPPLPQYPCKTCHAPVFIFFYSEYNVAFLTNKIHRRTYIASLNVANLFSASNANFKQRAISSTRLFLSAMFQTYCNLRSRRSQIG